MSYVRISSDGIPIENIEGTVLSSSARTATSSGNVLMNGGARDLFLILDVTSVGTVAGVAEVASLAVTNTVTTAGNVTVTLNGVGTNVALDPAVQLSATDVATAIRGTTFTGWTTGGSGTTVTFTSTTTGTKTDATYSAGSTGAAGTMTTTTQGVTAIAAPSITLTLKGKDFTSGKGYTIASGSAVSTTGTYVYMISKNAGTAHDGITAVFDTPIPKTMLIDITHGNGTTITYSVGYAFCL